MENVEQLENSESASIYNAREHKVQYPQALLPNLVVRIKAVFIDLVILLLVFAVTSLIMDAAGNVSPFIKGSIAIFMLYLYDPIFTAFTAGTIGHKIMKLKIKQLKDSDKNISLFAALLRFLVKASLGWISFFTVTGNTNKRAIHDLASGSIMLRKN